MGIYRRPLEGQAIMIPDDVKAVPVVTALMEALPEAAVAGKLERGELTLGIVVEKIVEVCRFLKHEQKFVRVSTVTGVDWYPEEPRFEVVYHLHAPERREWLRLKCRLAGADPEIDSVTGVWRGANWYERETFDLFGITFRNHPNLKRIMLPEDWEGYPLRKDYPVTGDRV